MSELIKEELLGTVRKKRFIILIALAYISAVIFVFYRKKGAQNVINFLKINKNHKILQR